MFGDAIVLEVPDASYRWTECDLARHLQLTQHAKALIAAVRATLWDFDETLREFSHVADAAGMRFMYERDREVLMWHLTLAGNDFRATGTVEVALETSNIVAILARPDGGGTLTFQAIDGQGVDFKAILRREFRTAVVSSVLDATTLITP